MVNVLIPEKFFGSAVNTTWRTSESRCTWWQKTTNRHTHTQTRGTTTVTIIFEALKLIRIIYNIYIRM